MLRHRTDCKKCRLHLTRHKRVIGRGSCPTDVLFIGEGPGSSEDLLGKPFVGPSGKLLDKLIVQADIDSYHITNIVQCRPCDSPSGQNREPTAEEVLSCRENLFDIVVSVMPKCVVFVGKIAEKYYRGMYPHATTILHPSFLLRSGGMSSPFWGETILKLCKVREAL